MITIEDSGKGIPTNMMEDIFEPLFTTKQQGTGLVLVNIKSIIQGHGGTISVTSLPIVFTIIMPKNPLSSSWVFSFDLKSSFFKIFYWTFDLFLKTNSI